MNSTVQVTSSLMQLINCCQSFNVKALGELLLETSFTYLDSIFEHHPLHSYFQEVFCLFSSYPQANPLLGLRMLL